MNRVTQQFAFSKRNPDLPIMGAAYAKTDPDIMPFAYGFPAPQAFPIAAFQEASQSALLLEGTRALQYTGGPGQKRVQAWIAQRSSLRGIKPEEDQLIVTTGSMQAIDMVTRVLTDEGDEVWVESPSFFGTIRSFITNGLNIRSFSIDEDGLCVDELEAALQRAEQTGCKMPKLLYIMPNYQNPSGATLSAARREKLARLALRHNFYILEDDAYVDLSFSGEYLPSVYSFAPERVVYISTFSKIIAPGVRMGWAIAESQVIERMKLFKSDGYTSVFVQEVVGQMLQQMDYTAHMNRINEMYRSRRDVMVTELRRVFGDQIDFQVPDGGFFLWVRFPEGVNTTEMLTHALECGVSFLDGQNFYLEGVDGTRFARLCYTYCDEESIKKGVAALHEAWRRSHSLR
ncbi:PLP-dependent aminotransferase family protein [Brevibacillus centrosporus]|uniref:aminotransferase-like domain-containing protein n=1 Tax=Brevibacillus centrosporus TaxID=54910 RepID=UPI003B014BBB